jgi:hypothetical protein
MSLIPGVVVLILIRKWTADLFNSHLGFITGPIDQFFDFWFESVIQDFNEYVSARSVEPGMLDCFFAALPVLDYLAFVTMGTWSTLELFRPVVDFVSSIPRLGKKSTQLLEWRSCSPSGQCAKHSV